MYQQLRALAHDAKRAGLAVDVVAHAAQIAGQLGAHIIKLKPPSAHVELEAARRVYEEKEIPIGTLRERVRLVVQSAFNGQRIVIFSGGPAKGRDAVLAEIREIAESGGFGSIMGRNSFQRSRSDAIELLHDVMDIHRDSPVPQVGAEEP